MEISLAGQRFERCDTSVIFSNQLCHGLQTKNIEADFNYVTGTLLDRRFSSRFVFAVFLWER